MTKTIVVLVLVMAYSGFAYHSVQNDEATLFKAENASLRDRLAKEKAARTQDWRNSAAKEQKVCDALTLLFPEKAKEVKAAFNSDAATQPVEKK